jgi:hypothetical protein
MLPLYQCCLMPTTAIHNFIYVVSLGVRVPAPPVAACKEGIIGCGPAWAVACQQVLRSVQQVMLAGLGGWGHGVQAQLVQRRVSAACTLIMLPHWVTIAITMPVRLLWGALGASGHTIIGGGQAGGTRWGRLSCHCTVAFTHTNNTMCTLVSAKMLL